MNFDTEQQEIITALQERRNLSREDAVKVFLKEQAEYDAAYEMFRVAVQPYLDAFNAANREFHAAPKKTRELTKKRNLATDAYEKAVRRLHPPDDPFEYLAYDAEGYDAEGFDKHGLNRDGFDSDGYDKQGYDAEGYDEEGNEREEEF